MDRNTITGFVLIGLLLFGYMFYSSRETTKLQEAQSKRKKEVADSIAKLPKAAPNTITHDTTTHDASGNPVSISATPAVSSSAVAPFVGTDSVAAKSYVLENEDLKVTFSSTGGEVAGVEAKKYKTFDGKPLVMVKAEDFKKSFSFVVGNTNINTADLHFESAGPVKNGDLTTLSLKAMAGDGKYLEQVYTIPNKGYLLDYKVNLVNLDSIIPNKVSYLNLDWSRRIPKLEKTKDYENKYTQLDFRYRKGDVERLSETKDAETKAASSIDWISIKQQFFNTTLINLDTTGMKSGNLVSKMEVDSHYLKSAAVSVVLPYNHAKTQTYSFQYYFGPNNYNALKRLDLDLEQIISMGWFGFVNKYLFIPSFHLLEKVFTNYGIIILILTLFIKLLLTPLTYKSQLSMAKMKVLKPELDELKEKYKDDQQKFGQAQMALFSKAGVSPLGGCLPMLLIMPFLIAMYNFFPNSIELRQQGFLWATDLSTYDSIAKLPFSFFDHLSLFTVLMTITSIASSFVNAQFTTQQDGPMKYMPYIMPLMFMYMFNSFPAALTYFYLLNNIISLGQQYAIQYFFIDEAKLHKEIQENKKKPAKAGGFGSGLMKRLEDAQKQQEQARKGGAKNGGAKKK